MGYAFRCRQMFTLPAAKHSIKHSPATHPNKAFEKPKTRPLAATSFTSPPPMPPRIAAKKKGTAANIPRSFSGEKHNSAVKTIMKFTQSGMIRLRRSLTAAMNKRLMNKAACIPSLILVLPGYMLMPPMPSSSISGSCSGVCSSSI